MKVKEKIRIIVVCGNNARIQRIRAHYAREKNDDKIVEIHGFVNNVLS